MKNIYCSTLLRKKAVAYNVDVPCNSVYSVCTPICYYARVIILDIATFCADISSRGLNKYKESGMPTYITQLNNNQSILINI